MSSFGSDGASVMIGCRNGVATKLLPYDEQMLSVHCICHRLALASGQAAYRIERLSTRLVEVFSLLTCQIMLP